MADGSGFVAPKFKWTDSAVAEMTRLWADGKSASAIAQAIGAPTPSTVIGKAHRLNLPPRPSPIRRPGGPLKPLSEEERRQRRLISQRAYYYRTKGALVPIEERRIRHKASATIRRAMTPLVNRRLSATAKCQFIEGEPSHDDACKCLAPAIEGSAWCPGHHALVYIPYVQKAKAA